MASRKGQARPTPSKSSSTIKGKTHGISATYTKNDAKPGPSARAVGGGAAAAGALIPPPPSAYATPSPNPIHSFLSLQKLHSSLGRRGRKNGDSSNHLKMTNEEYAQFGYWLRNLEPFVIGLAGDGSTTGSTTPSSLSSAISLSTLLSIPTLLSPLTRQPTEVLDQIISYIPLPSTLLNLSLTCWKLCNVIIPRHLGFRVIRAKVNGEEAGGRSASKQVWKLIGRDWTLGRNVRVLEVLSGGAGSGKEGLVLPPIPNSNTNDSDQSSSDNDSHGDGDEEELRLDKHLSLHEAQLRTFLKALYQTTHLTKFSWNMQPLSSTLTKRVLGAGAGGGILFDDIVDVLFDRCRLLEELEVCDKGIYSDLDLDSSDIESSEEEDKNITAKQKNNILYNLRSITIHPSRQNYPPSKPPTLKRLQKILGVAPNLTSLNLALPPPRYQAQLPLNDIFEYTHWPQLKELSLGGFVINMGKGGAEFRRFLYAHKNLEILNLGLGLGVSVPPVPPAPEATTTGAPIPIPTSTIGANPAEKISRYSLIPGSLPNLKDITANPDFINLVLECPTLTPTTEGDEYGDYLDLWDVRHDEDVLPFFTAFSTPSVEHEPTTSPRQIQSIKGPFLSAFPHTQSNTHASSSMINSTLRFLHALSPSTSSALAPTFNSAQIKHLSLIGYGDMEDIKKLSECGLEGLVYLDIGRKISSHSTNPFHQTAPGTLRNAGGKQLPPPPIPNILVLEWATILSSFPNLSTFYGVRFFYGINEKVLGVIGWDDSDSSKSPNHVTTSSAVSQSPLQVASSLSLADKSRIKKNDEIASILAWKCTKLRRVDYWSSLSSSTNESREAAMGGKKVVVILREGGGAGSGEKGKGKDKEGLRENLKVRWEVRKVAVAV